jgi:hypothetical protein
MIGEVLYIAHRVRRVLFVGLPAAGLALAFVQPWRLLG